VISLRATQTSIAFRNIIQFWRQHSVILDTVRMYNQRSHELKSTFTDLKLQASLVSPYDKAPNRAERTIRTCKNLIIAGRCVRVSTPTAHTPTLIKVSRKLN
jgi:hypothetical protein